jgi:chromosomal replication initiation ATPase DnaA
MLEIEPETRSAAEILSSYQRIRHTFRNLVPAHQRRPPVYEEPCGPPAGLFYMHKAKLRPRITQIIAAAAVHFDVSFEEVASTSKTRKAAAARAMAIYIARDIHSYAAGEVSRILSPRDRGVPARTLKAFIDRVRSEPALMDEVIAVSATADRIRAEEAEDLIRAKMDGAQAEPTMRDILAAVSAHYDASVVDVLSHRRTLLLSKPRFAVAYLGATVTKQTLPQIGRAMGGRDHSTIHHSVRRAHDLMRVDEQFASDIAAIAAKLGCNL